VAPAKVEMDLGARQVARRLSDYRAAMKTSVRRLSKDSEGTWSYGAAGLLVAADEVIN